MSKSKNLGYHWVSLYMRTPEKTVTIRVTQLILVIFILFAPIAEAFVAPTFPCPNMNTMSMLADVSDTNHFMMDGDCCMDECDCDAGMVTLPMLIHAKHSNKVNVSSLKISPAHLSFFQLYLNHPQRPPQPFTS